MTTLGSWIDDEALAQVIDDLCPRSSPAGVEEPERYIPRIGLEPGDLYRPELYGESKFPDYFPEQREKLPQAAIAVPVEPEEEDVSAGSAPREGTGMIQRLASLKERAERSGLIGTGLSSTVEGKFPSTASSPPDTEFQAPVGPLSKRLESFVRWAKTLSRGRHVCLADAAGRLLGGDSEPAGLPLAASLLAGAMVRAENSYPLGSALHCSIGRGEVLTIIAIREAGQEFSIAVVAGAPQSSATSSALTEGFLTVLRHPGDH